MNTTTLPASGSILPTSTEAHTDQLLIGTVADIDQHLAQLDADRARLLKEREAKAREEEILLREKRHATILTLPALLFVNTQDEVIALIRDDSAKVITAAPKPVKLAKGQRYSDEVRDQVKAAMVAKTPVAQIAKHFRIGEATLWIWRRAWGLTNPAAKRNRKAAPKAKPTKGRKLAFKAPLSDARREQLLTKMREGKTPMSQLAKQFGLSRARGYQIAAQHGIQTPGLQAAA